MAEEALEVPQPPGGLDERLRTFWSRTVEAYELTDSEVEMLRELVFTMRELQDLRLVLERDGVTAVGSTGQTRVHPAVNEIRQHRMAMARLLKALDLPAEDEPETQATKDARAAAQARWAMQKGREARG